MRRTPILEGIVRFALVCFLLSAASVAQVSVLTHRYNAARDGVNGGETALTLSSVNVGNFGKLFSFPTDGYTYAQPLYMANVAIPGIGTHNLVFVATEHGSVYAYDADGLLAQPIWQVSLPTLGCPSGFTCTSVPASANSSTTDLLPEVSITGTPVIDSGTIYVVAKAKEVNGGTINYNYRLHALDVTTGAERAGSPALISGSASGKTFSALYSLQRPGLALSANSVFIAFGSWGDASQWYGWVFGYDKTSLLQTAIFNAAPGGHAGVWMSGSAPAVDASGFLYLTTGNGAFDGINNFGDSFLKLGTSLTVSSYFAPFNQQTLDSIDLDVSSGGVVLLPDSAGTVQHPHILMGCGKNGTVYVLDRDSLGGFNSAGDTQIIQEIPNLVGGTPWNGTAYVFNCHATPAYWQGNVYLGGVKDAIKMFTFSNGQISTSAASQTSLIYSGPGVSPVISANGSSNGILWAIENTGTKGTDRAGTAVLHAYDAINLANELYNTTQVASDAVGGYVKFSIPTVVNGKVYVGTQSSLAVYGLITSVPQAPAPVLSPPGGTYATAQSVSFSDALPPSSTTFYYTTDGSLPTTSSSVYGGPITIGTNTVLRAIAVASGYRASPVTTETYTIGSGGGGANPLFVQGVYATPQTSQSSVVVNYPGAQRAGNLNIVAVGWNDATSTVSNVSDSRGNSYSLAIGPTTGTGLRQSIYYARNIAAGSNAVTVTFNQAAVFVDVRVLEYSGLDTVNPLDKTAGAAGTGTSASSGAATTTSAKELIFGAGMTTTHFTGAGSGFVSRMITVPDADIAEDQIVGSTGSYSATAPATSSKWVMQMATFRAGGQGSSNPAPAVTAITPTSGTTAGGTAVTITGTGFLAGATLSLGGTAATSVTVVSPTSITATTAAHLAGAVSVVVTNSDSQSGTLNNGYSYISPNPAPTVASISPASGTTAGGTAVTITGTGFLTGATVKLGGTSATGVTVVNSTSITATAAAHAAGAVSVVVTNTDTQSGTLPNGYTYVSPNPAPTVSAIAPTSGTTAGGTPVTITGTGFLTGATVSLGGTAATGVTVASSTSITATTAAHAAGAVSVVVTNTDTQTGTLPSGYTYVSSNPAPTVTAITPTSGTTAGGTAITITGSGFLTGATLSLGGTAATGVTVASSTSITATTAAHAAGAVSVVVTNTDTQTGTLPSGYTYVSSNPAPTVTAITPTSGTTAGGTAITITGTGFLTGATLSLGGTAATGVTVASSTSIRATTAAHAAGAVNVVVTNTDAQSGTLPNGYTYTTSTGGGPIAFVQVKAATPQTPSASVAVAYPLAQTAGNLNIVAVGWNDTAATVSTISDTRGNIYTLALGPTSGTGLRQSIYYAKNIAAGSNTVTVTFNQAAVFVDVRVLEYSGLDTATPFDKAAGAAGTGTAASSGAVTTTSASELIFGAGMTTTHFTGPGSGFVSRIITTPDADIAEDRTVTATGSYSATAPATSSNWVMQIATFKAKT